MGQGKHGWPVCAGAAGRFALARPAGLWRHWIAPERMAKPHAVPGRLAPHVLPCTAMYRLARGRYPARGAGFATRYPQMVSGSALMARAPDTRRRAQNGAGGLGAGGLGFFRPTCRRSALEQTPAKTDPSCQTSVVIFLGNQIFSSRHGCKIQHRTESADSQSRIHLGRARAPLQRLRLPSCSRSLSPRMRVTQATSVPPPTPVQVPRRISGAPAPSATRKAQIGPARRIRPNCAAGARGRTGPQKTRTRLRPASSTGFGATRVAHPPVLQGPRQFGPRATLARMRKWLHRRSCLPDTVWAYEGDNRQQGAHQ